MVGYSARLWVQERRMGEVKGIESGIGREVTSLSNDLCYLFPSFLFRMFPFILIWCNYLLFNWFLSEISN